MHSATPGDIWRGTLIFAIGVTLVLLCWSGLVYRYVQPGFFWFVLISGVGLLALGLAVQWRAAQGFGLGHGTKVSALLILPLLLVIFAAPGPLVPTSSRVVVRQEQAEQLPPLHGGINDMTVLDFPHYADMEGTQVRMIGQVTEVEDGWMLTRYRILCCAADATLHGVKMLGAVPDADWVEVTGVATQGALQVVSVAPIKPPERPYL